MNRKNLLLLLIIFSIIGCEENINEPKIASVIKSISFIGVQDSSIIYNPTKFSVEIVSTDSITKVVYFIDSDSIGSAFVKPYLIEPDISRWSDDSTHTLKCIVYDVTGNSKSQVLHVIISVIPRYRIELLSPQQNDVIRWTNNIELKWEAIENYNFEIGIAKDYSFNNIVHTLITNQKNIITPPLEKGSYYWQVSIIPDSSGKKYKSGIFHFSINGPKPPDIFSHKPEEIRAYKKVDRFTWSKSEFADQYQIQLIDYHTANLLSEEIINDTSVTKDLELYVYQLRVRAKNNAGIWGDWSSTITFSNGLYTKEIEMPAGTALTACINSPDSGIIVAAYSYVSRETILYSIDQTGNEKSGKWISDFTPNSITTTHSDEILMTGSSSNFKAKVVKLDKNLNVVWSYEPGENKYLADILSLNDGNYLVTGSDGENNINKIYLLKLSASGSPLLEKRIGDERSSGYKLAEINGNYLIMGKQTDTLIYSQAVYNLIVNQNGDILSEKKYLEFTGFPAQNYDIRDGMLINNDIYCAGSFGTAYGSFVHKSDIYGNEHWKKELINASPSMAYSCTGIDDNNIFVAGYEQSQGQSAFLFNVNSSGNIIWRKNYESSSCVDIIKTYDSGFLLLGFHNTSLAKNYIYLIKINKDGITYD